MFHKNRATALGAALEMYGQAQLLVARDLATVVQTSLDQLKSFDWRY